MDGKENKVTAERLTGKQRCLRGVRCFLWTFAIAFGAFMVVLDWTTPRPGTEPGRDMWTGGAIVGLMASGCVASVAGLIMMAFPVCRWWHWIFALLVPVLALFAA